MAGPVMRIGEWAYPLFDNRVVNPVGQTLGRLYLSYICSELSGVFWDGEKEAVYYTGKPGEDDGTPDHYLGTVKGVATGAVLFFIVYAQLIGAAAGIGADWQFGIALVLITIICGSVAVYVGDSVDYQEVEG